MQGILDLINAIEGIKAHVPSALDNLVKGTPKYQPADLSQEPNMVSGDQVHEPNTMQKLLLAMPNQLADGIESVGNLASMLPSGPEQAGTSLAVGPLGAFEGEAKGPIEKIMKAAFKVDGKIYESGKLHDYSKLPIPDEKFFKLMDEGKVTDGFITNKGRFVDRMEAEILKYGKNDPGNRNPGLDSNDIWGHLSDKKRK